MATVPPSSDISDTVSSTHEEDDVTSPLMVVDEDIVPEYALERQSKANEQLLSTQRMANDMLSDEHKDTLRLDTLPFVEVPLVKSNEIKAVTPHTIKLQCHAHMERTKDGVDATKRLRTEISPSLVGFSGALLPKGAPLLVRRDAPSESLPSHVQHTFGFKVAELFQSRLSAVALRELCSPDERINTRQMGDDQVVESVDFQVPFERLKSMLHLKGDDAKQQFDFQLYYIAIANAVAYNASNVSCVIVPFTFYDNEPVMWSEPESALESYTVARAQVLHCAGQKCHLSGGSAMPAGAEPVGIKTQDATCFLRFTDSADLTCMSVLAEYTEAKLVEEWTASIDTNDSVVNRSGVETGARLYVKLDGVHAANMLSFLWYNHEGIRKASTTTERVGNQQSERLYGVERVKAWRKQLGIEKRFASLKDGLWLRVLFTGDLPWKKLKQQTQFVGAIVGKEGGVIGANRLDVLDGLFKVELELMIKGHELERARVTNVVA